MLIKSSFGVLLFKHTGSISEGVMSHIFRLVVYKVTYNNKPGYYLNSQLHSS